MLDASPSFEPEPIWFMIFAELGPVLVAFAALSVAFIAARAAWLWWRK